MLIIDDSILMCLEEVEVKDVVVRDGHATLTTEDTGRYVWLVTHCCGAKVPLCDTYCGTCGMPME